MKKTIKKLAPIQPPTFQQGKSIPKPKINRNEKLLFSFRLLDFSLPYYNCNGMCDKGIKNCFEKLKLYSNFSVNEIRSGKGGSTLKFHNHEKDKVDDWPKYLVENEELEESFFQIGFGLSKGRAHGILIDNVFYVIWLDPHHYLYHDARYGPKKAYAGLEDCCACRESIIDSQADEIEKLKLEIKEYKELLNEKTKPEKEHSQ